tara:strand:+ start:525 stop:1004 length:480 start_codon:yes stop_codon:yes gene_type:complete
MKLTSKGRFAVTALVDLAINNSSKPVSLSDICSRQNIPISFLEQIFNLLKKDGIVKSIRGPSGGYTLSKKPEKISIADVIAAINEELKITKCNGIDFGCSSQKHSGKCLTHNLWAELGNHIYFYLSSISIEDVRKNNLNPISNLMNSKIENTNFLEVRK